jgi:phosphopantothenoylcysteine decarboxylase/phosphopantothenate--cysteine ligase
MARILITSGPTRQYLDPVRYLTNASSGKMGAELAAAALDLGHEVVLVSGPVDRGYPVGVDLHWVVSTEEMLEVCQREFVHCDGLIGVAAPCDYRPLRVEEHKISKTGDPLLLKLIETPDIVATLAADRAAHQWVVGFALETEDQRFRAITKLERKRCDLIVLNGPDAMNADENRVELLDKSEGLIAACSGPKAHVAREILRVIDQRLCR